jgi:hypothetical protein
VTPEGVVSSTLIQHYAISSQHPQTLQEINDESITEKPPTWTYHLGWKRGDAPLEKLSQAEKDYHAKNSPGWLGMRFRSNLAKQTRCRDSTPESCEECPSAPRSSSAPTLEYEYKLKGSGTCEDDGYDTIDDEAGCLNAKLALGRSDFETFTTSSAGRAKGCVINCHNEHIYGGCMKKSGPVQFFPHAKGVCGTEFFHCVCRRVKVASSQYYRFRFTPTKVRSSGFQISELSFKSAGSDVNMAGATATGNFQSHENAANAIDGSVHSKACCAIGPISVTFPAPTSIDQFSFVTANDAIGRDPVQWKLEGSIDGSSWTLLHEQSSDYATTTNRMTRSEWFSCVPASLAGLSVPSAVPAPEDECWYTKSDGHRGMRVASTSGKYKRFESHIHMSCPSPHFHLTTAITKLQDGEVKLYWNVE